jgi:hypothetical protein
VAKTRSQRRERATVAAASRSGRRARMAWRVASSNALSWSTAPAAADWTRGGGEGFTLFPSGALRSCAIAGEGCETSNRLGDVQKGEVFAVLVAGGVRSCPIAGEGCEASDWIGDAIEWEDFALFLAGGVRSCDIAGEGFEMSLWEAEKGEDFGLFLAGGVPTCAIAGEE